MKHLPLEMMQAFVRVVEHEGNAKTAADVLGISQSTMSRRLSGLRELIGETEGQPWLVLKGKRWLLTANGERVRGVVSDLVRQYEQVERFISDVNSAQPHVSIACGQTAASGFVRLSVERLLEINPEFRIRVSTQRGKSRIEGVAGGQFDIAIVTDNVATIRYVAGIELFVEPLRVDRFVVAAKPKEKSSWAKKWNSLPVRRPLTAKDIEGLPMILPEPSADRRQQFDSWYQHNVGAVPNVAVEVGGWHNLLSYAESGIGVGFATESAVQQHMEVHKKPRSASKSSWSIRMLHEKDFPPDEIRLIARKQQGQTVPDLSEAAQQFYGILKKQARLAKGN